MAPSPKPGFVPANPNVNRISSSARARTPLPTTAHFTTQPAVRFPYSSPNLSTHLSPTPTANFFNNPPGSAARSGSAIVLFRSDLRIDDHPALVQAAEEAATVVPVFCFDPRHFGRTSHGFDKTGKYRARFLIESVTNLRKSFKKLGSDLVVRFGKPEDVVPDLAAQVGANRVFLHREVTFEEQQVEDQLNKALKGRGVEMKSMWANTLYHLEDLPFNLDKMPDVYSDFREAVEQKSAIRDPLPAPEELAILPAHVEVGEIPTLSTLGLSDTSMPVSEGVSSVTGGEDEAMRRVFSYISDSRKHDMKRIEGAQVTAHLGADFSCRISPWLALGCLSPRRIFKEMSMDMPAPHMLLRSSTYFELVWRDFFRCITAKYSERRAKTVGKSVHAPVAMAAAR